eukprot:s5488_g2.t1
MTEDSYPWICPCGRLNRKTAEYCAISTCHKHWSLGKMHDVTPKRSTTYRWDETWEQPNWREETWEDETWTDWEGQATPRKHAQSPRGRQPTQQDQSPRSRAKGKGKAKGKSKRQDADIQAGHPFGKGSFASMPPWPTWDVTEAGISPFQSNAQSSTPAADPIDLSSMQEAATHLRLAYKDPDSRPPEVQSFIERAEREANRSNIKSLHATTRGLDKAQKALQDAVTAKKEHRLHWTKHVSEGIKVWEAQLESYRVHQANLSEHAAKARAEITAARRNIQLLSDRAVTEGSAAIPQPIRAEAEDAVVDVLDDPDEQKLRKQLQGVLNACASSLGISVDQASEEKGVQEILSDNDEDKPSKRPRSAEPAVKTAPAGTKS